MQIGAKRSELAETAFVTLSFSIGQSRRNVTPKPNRYRTVCNHIREFLPHTYKREDIPLKELNLTFINDFEYFLRAEKKCRTNTVWGYLTQKEIQTLMDAPMKNTCHETRTELVRLFRVHGFGILGREEPHR